MSWWSICQDPIRRLAISAGFASAPAVFKAELSVEIVPFDGRSRDHTTTASPIKRGTAMSHRASVGPFSLVSGGLGDCPRLRSARQDAHLTALLGLITPQ